jgi:hypothetical protein
MTEDELKIEAELQAQIEAELQAQMARKRMEIARRLRREAEMKEYDRINAWHPIQGPGSPDVTGHRSLELLKTYSRDAEAFVGHAGAGLL